MHDEGSAAGHAPVLVDEVVDLLVRNRGAGRTCWVFLDCTLGPGGHARALLEASGKDARLVGMDADESNVVLAQRNLAPYRGRVRFFHANFADAPEVLRQAGLSGVDGLLADLGFASTQVDDPQRGLSFTRDGPLDMRLDRSAGPTAADLVNRLDESDLADLIYRFGEERHSRGIARAIVTARQSRRIERTGELADLVRGAIPGRRGKIDPATRTFQALRIAVNGELDRLAKLLEALPNLLNPGGRAAIISFHSLEDRPVKQAFAALAQTDQANWLTKKPITPAEPERNRNPRARSAKLRAMEWIGPSAG